MTDLQILEARLKNWIAQNLSKDMQACIRLNKKPSSTYSRFSLRLVFPTTLDSYWIYLMSSQKYKIYENGSRNAKFYETQDEVFDYLIEQMKHVFDLVSRYENTTTFIKYPGGEALKYGVIDESGNITAAMYEEMKKMFWKNYPKLEQYKDNIVMAQHPTLAKIDEKRAWAQTKICLITSAEKQLKNLNALLFRLRNEEELMQKESSTIEIGGAGISIQSTSPLGRILILKAINFIEADIIDMKNDLERYEKSI